MVRITNLQEFNRDIEREWDEAQEELNREIGQRLVETVLTGQAMTPVRTGAMAGSYSIRHDDGGTDVRILRDPTKTILRGLLPGDVEGLRVTDSDTQPVEINNDAEYFSYVDEGNNSIGPRGIVTAMQTKWESFSDEGDT